MVELHIPESVEIEILSWLPVKSLLRFQSVCKSWHRLIKSPFFANFHLSRSTILPRRKSNSSLLTRVHYHDDIGEMNYASLLCNNLFNITKDIALTPLKADLHIASSCNGLVCIHDFTFDNPFILLNPATRELKYLPAPPLLSNYSPKHKKSHTGSIAFGFDRVTNDYKVVRIVNKWKLISGKKWEKRGTPRIPKAVQIYYLRDKKWRNTDIVVPAVLEKLNRHNTYIDGVYNWFAYIPNGPSFILSFDMVKEEFKTIELPEFLTQDHILELVSWKGTLAISRYHEESLSFHQWPQPFCFEIWTDTKSCKEFTKKAAFGPIMGFGQPLGFWEDEERLLLRSYDAELVSYDLKTQELKHHQIYESCLMLQVAFYQESLVSID